MIETSQKHDLAAMRSRAGADVALIFIALVWGGTFVVVKAALADVSVMCFLALRFGIAALCLIFLFGAEFRRMPGTELRRGFLGGIITGGLLWLGYGLQTWGLERTTASNSGFLTGLYNILVPLISAACYRRWPRSSELTGISIASAGMVLLTAPPSLKHFQINKGDVLTIGCAIAFAFHLIVLGYYSQRERFEAVATGQVISTCFLSCLALPFEIPHIVWSGQVVFALVATGVLATAVAFAIQTWAQRYCSPTRTALILSLEPVFAYVTAVAFAGEHLSARSAIGGSLIIAGILSVELKRPK